jgi:carbon dioxide concentrating mechanism protein CcmM
LNQGHKIGAEHADKRRFKTSSWQSCTPIESSRESDVVAALETCLRDHQGEYVRLIGIDSQAKRGVRCWRTGKNTRNSNPYPLTPDH